MHARIVDRTHFRIHWNSIQHINSYCKQLFRSILFIRIRILRSFIFFCFFFLFQFTKRSLHTFIFYYFCRVTPLKSLKCKWMFTKYLACLQRIKYDLVTVWNIWIFLSHNTYSALLCGTTDAIVSCETMRHKQH